MDTASKNYPFVTASIVTWNHAHCIEACLTSLLKQTYRNIQVVVCDNASSDNTRNVLKKFGDRVRLVYSPENRGFCGGHNAVISQTQSEFVLLVNPDIILRENYVENAIQRIQMEADIGTVCGLLVQNEAGENSVIDGVGLNVGRSRRFFLPHHGQQVSAANLKRGEVFGCDGALPLYRRKMIEELSCNGQFFDEMFFAHKEDHDISWRARLFGWRTIFEPACIAVHPRVFRPGDLQVRKALAPEIKFHAVKNDLLLLLKNEDLSNFLKDFFYIVPRRIAIFVYILFLEPRSLKAYWFVLKNLSPILARRKVIQQKRSVSPAAIRKRFQ